MSQPVKLSDTLVLDARMTGELTERSINSQIEFWASLGKAIESLVGLPQVLALKRSAAVEPLSKLIASVDSEQGRTRVREYLTGQPFPQYEATDAGRLVRIEQNGTRTVGRFVNREFQPERKPARKSARAHA